MYVFYVPFKSSVCPRFPEIIKIYVSEDGRGFKTFISQSKLSLTDQSQLDHKEDMVGFAMTHLGAYFRSSQDPLRGLFCKCFDIQV